MTMMSSQPFEHFTYRYLVINVNDIAFEDLLYFSKAGDVVLALLGNFGHRQKEDAI